MLNNLHVHLISKNKARKEAWGRERKEAPDCLGNGKETGLQDFSGCDNPDKMLTSHGGEHGPVALGIRPNTWRHCPKSPDYFPISEAPPTLHPRGLPTKGSDLGLHIMAR